MAKLEGVNFNKLMTNKITDQHTLVIDYYDIEGKKHSPRFKKDDTILIENIKTIAKAKIGYNTKWKIVTDQINRLLKDKEPIFKFKTNKNNETKSIRFIMKYQNNTIALSIINHFKLLSSKNKYLKLVILYSHENTFQQEEHSNIIYLKETSYKESCYEIFSSDFGIQINKYTPEFDNYKLITFYNFTMINNTKVFDVLKRIKTIKNVSISDINCWINDILNLRSVYPNQQLVPYAMNKGMPYHNNGYATRSYNIIKTFNSMYPDIKYFGLYRLGYPINANKKLINEETFLHIVNGVYYLAFPKVPFHKYNLLLSIITHILDIKSFHSASSWCTAKSIINFCNKNKLRSIYEIRGIWQMTKLSKLQYYKRKLDNESKKIFDNDDDNEIYCIKNATNTLFITDQVYNYYSKKIKIKNKIIFPNCFEIQNNTQFMKPNNKNKFIIGYAGSIIFYEGILKTIESIDQIIKNKRVKMDIELHLVGDTSKIIREIKYMWNRDINELFNKKFIKLYGAVPHDTVAEIIKTFDLYVIPRLDLPVTNVVSPIKPFEPMALKIPLLMSNCDALKDISKNGKNSMLFKKNSFKDFSDKIVDIVNNGYSQKIIDNGYEFVKNERNWEKMIENIGLRKIL